MIVRGALGLVLAAVTALAAACGDAAPERAAASTPTPAKPTRFVPVAPVLARIDRYVDAPVGLPDLPPGTLAFRKPQLYGIDGVRTGILAMRLPDGRLVNIMYGVGAFDGCGPTNPKHVRINGQPGILSRSTTVSTVVWPTTDATRNGTYAITAELPRREILTLARSMDANGRNTSERGGC